MMLHTPRTCLSFGFCTAFALFLSPPTDTSSRLTACNDKTSSPPPPPETSTLEKDLIYTIQPCASVPLHFFLPSQNARDRLLGLEFHSLCHRSPSLFQAARGRMLGLLRRESDHFLARLVVGLPSLLFADAPIVALSVARLYSRDVWVSSSLAVLGGAGGAWVWLVMLLAVCMSSDFVRDE